MAYIAKRAAAAALASLICSAAWPASAKPLDAETCQRIKGDLEGLEKQGVRDLMARGPANAKSLDPAQLQKVRNFIDLDAQARFRCGERAFIPSKEEPPEEAQEAGAAPATIDNTTPGITLPPGAQSVGPVVPPVKRRPPPAAAKVPTVQAAPAQTDAPPPAAKKAAPKAKTASPAAPASAASSAEADPPVPKPKAPPARKAEKPKTDDAYRPLDPAKTE